MFAHVVRRCRVWFAVSSLLLAAGLPIAASGQAAASLDAQRAAFKQAWAAAKQGGDGWRTYAPQLRGYALYPYLQAAALEHDIASVDDATVQAYLTQYPDLIPAQDLRRTYLRELASRQDWAGFRTFYRPGLGDAFTCYALEASLAAGAPLDFDRDLAALWAKPELPSACDPVLQAARTQGLLTDTRLWARIDRAASAGKGGTVAALAAWLPSAQAGEAQRIALALRDPNAAVAAAASWPDTLRARQAAAITLERAARRNVDAADAAWQRLQANFRFSQAQRDDITRALALFHATDFEPDAGAQLAALPASAQTDATREWRARVALAAQDWPGVLAAIAAMPANLQQDGEWRWFRARALRATNHPVQARDLVTALAGEATYYGFLAADQVQQPYAICPQTPPVDASQAPALLGQMPGLDRAFELYAVDLPQLARREWNRALDGSDASTRALAAELANQRGWFDRAVFTFTSGKALRYYTLRFPLAAEDGLVAQARQAGVAPAWAYGILRSESAWVTDARSGADARGLMQLLPATAAKVAQQNGLPWAGGDSLYVPTVNIALGTRHLAELAARFNGSPWLASAAYNAGAAKVEQWLAARGTLSPDLFVATIPYKETREYVARVMAFSVIYDWRLHGNPLPMSARMPAIGQAYTPPGADATRKTVACPAATTASTP